MTTLRDTSPFSGLPPTLVSALIERGDVIGGQLAESMRTLIGARDDLRGRVAGQPGIATVSTTDTTADMPIWGLAMACHTVSLAAGDLQCAAAFATPGIRTEGEPRWRCETIVESTFDGTTEVLPALASILALELAGETETGVVLADETLTAITAHVLEGVMRAVPIRDTATGKAYLTRLNTTIQLLKGLFAGTGSGATVAGVLSESGGRELTSAIEGTAGADDLLLGTAILDPGEYTVPMPVEGSCLDSVASLPIKDETFAGLRDNIVAAARCMVFVLFRPHSWTPAYRIELPEAVAGDGARLTAVLEAVSAESVTPGSRRPYPLISATEITTRFETAAEALGTAITTRMLGDGAPDRGDLATFLLT
jgi:hypothetical protein